MELSPVMRPATAPDAAPIHALRAACEVSSSRVYGSKVVQAATSTAPLKHAESAFHVRISHPPWGNVYSVAAYDAGVNLNGM
jgi:hypothetical protein